MGEGQRQWPLRHLKQDEAFLPRALGVGCNLAGLYMRVVGYAADLLLLAHSRKAAQLMLTRFERFTGINNIQFSTNPDPTRSKSKAINVVGPRGAVLVGRCRYCCAANCYCGWSGRNTWATPCLRTDSGTRLPREKAPIS